MAIHNQKVKWAGPHAQWIVRRNNEHTDTVVDLPTSWSADRRYGIELLGFNSPHSVTKSSNATALVVKAQ